MTPWFAILLLTAAPSPGPAGGIAVGYVDIKQAILNTVDGQRIKTKLEAENLRVSGEIRKKEEQLMRERSVLEPKQYDEKAQKIQEEIAKRQEALEKKQDDLLEPLIRKMETILQQHNKTKMPPKIVDLSEQPLVDPPKECDLTTWLTRAYADEKVAPPETSGDCMFRAFLYVDFDRTLALSAAGKAATQRLDAFKEKGQAEIDRRQRQLAEIQRSAKSGRPETKAEYERERRELAQLFAKYQKELEQKEIDTEGQLYERLEKNLASTAKQLRQVLFVEALEDQTTRLEPSCDATDWAAKVIDGKGTAGELARLCPLAKK